jgi:hypothetical protein
MENTERKEGRQTAEGFYNWAYKGRGKMVKRMLDGEEIPKEEVFLGFTTHTPTFVSHGSMGLNASVKGVGWVPKYELLPGILAKYKAHIRSYTKDDKTYQQRGLKILYDNLYSEEGAKNIDFSIMSSVEMAYVHSFTNYSENPEATLLFYQPPGTTFELRGRMSVYGKRYAKGDNVGIEDLDIYQQFINAQHDMYHMPNTDGWKTRCVYIFKIERMFNNGLGPMGFGKPMELEF